MPEPATTDPWPLPSARLDLTLEAGDRVLVTGAGGFIGSAIVRQLLARSARVVAMVEPGATERNLDGLGAEGFDATNLERVEVDLRDAAGVDDMAKECRAIFHVAALYRFWAPDPKAFYDINVGGTRNVMSAAARAGAEKVVYTSTVGTLGLDGMGQGVPADEDCYPDVSHLFGSYKRSKYVAEHEALRAAAQGLPVTMVMPTFPVGPRDVSPTPSGRLVRDFLDGKFPAVVDTALNVAHVDDVANGHVLALERGARGRGYVLGGENLTLTELLGTLSRQTGLPVPRMRVPRGVALTAAYVSDTVEGRLLHREPFVPIEATRMSTTHMTFDDRRARHELGYTSRPAADALGDAARWFVDNGYVRPSRVRRIIWAASVPGVPT